VPMEGAICIATVEVDDRDRNSETACLPGKS
jgi:hypothetical protein